ncbi:MAG: hypothetical protein H6742_06125 [Alphaproteobacteria bacterium]|nr:hypothetical protein [Alphaproteobacteria bacterium]
MSPALVALLALPLWACGDKAVGTDSGAGGDDSGTIDGTDVPEGAVAEAGPALVGHVGEVLTLDGSGSVGESFLWDFGDGERVEGEAVVDHAWAEPGTFTAVIQVTGADGGKRSDSTTVTITLPAADVPPSRSSPLAVGPDGVVWAVFPEAGEVRRCEGDLSSCRSVAVCGDPRALAVRAEGADDARVAVACAEDGAVVVLDGDGVEQARHDLGPGSWPWSVAWHAERGLVAALAGPGEVAFVDEGTRVPVGPEPRGLVVAPDGAVYAARYRGDADGNRVYVVEDGAWTDTLSLAVDTTPDSDTTTRGTPNLIEQLAISPDGGTLLVPALHANILRGEYREGVPLAQDQVLRAVVGTVDLASGAETARKQLDERGRTIAVVPSPSGDRLFALHPGSQAITVLSATSLDVSGAILGLGEHPIGLAFGDDADRLYVLSWLSRELRLYDISALPSPPSLLATAVLGDTEPLDPTVLRGKQLFFSSADTRITTSGYIACAHCHPDGGHDGQVWDFTDRGEGLRNTTSLHGMGTGALTADPDLGLATGRLHWSGNFDEAQDFENDIRGHFGGTGLLSDPDWAESSDTLGPEKQGRSDDLDALATYMHSLAETPASPDPIAVDESDLFTASGCAECHSGDAMTDSARTEGIRHDVGTLTDASGGRLGGELDGLDTPTLRGLWETAPYLHDGSADTIGEAIVAHTDVDADTAERLATWLRGL